MPGGNGEEEEEEGGCRGLEITGGESSEGRGQRVGVTWGSAAFSSCFHGFFSFAAFLHPVVPHMPEWGFGIFCEFYVFPPFFPPSSPWLSAISGSQTQGSHGPLPAPGAGSGPGEPRAAWGLSSSLQNGVPRRAGALLGDPPCGQRGQRLPQEPRQHLPHVQRVCRAPSDHAPAFPWARPD